MNHDLIRFLKKQSTIDLFLKFSMSKILLKMIIFQSRLNDHLYSEVESIILIQFKLST
jgi:hypothetical protein